MLRLILGACGLARTCLAISDLALLTLPPSHNSLSDFVSNLPPSDNTSLSERFLFTISSTFSESILRLIEWLMGFAWYDREFLSMMVLLLRQSGFSSLQKLSRRWMPFDLRIRPFMLVFMYSFRKLVDGIEFGCQLGCEPTPIFRRFCRRGVLLLPGLLISCVNYRLKLKTVAMSESAICSKCAQTVERILSLECAHNLCVRCSARQLGRSQRARQGTVNHLECEICGVMSYLHPTTLDELLGKGQAPENNLERSAGHISYGNNPQQTYSSRKQLLLPQQHTALRFSPGKSTRPADNPVMLFCFTCQTPCFSVDEYISGLHKSHQVANTTKQESINTLKSLLEEINEKVRKRIETSLKQSTKLTQKKRELIEQLGRTKSTLRGVFDKLREAILSKENELITQLQTFMSRKFSVVDGALLQVKLFTEKCENLQDSIRCYQEAILPADVVKAYDFYSQRKGDIFQEIAYKIEQVAQKAVGNTGNLVIQYESLLDLSEQVKKAKVLIGEESVTVQENYFQVIKQEIFNQRTRREDKEAKDGKDIKDPRNLLEFKQTIVKDTLNIPFSPLNPTLSRIKSLGDIRNPDDRLTILKKPFNQTSISLQSRLKEKMRGLESIRQRENVRLLRRFNFV